jgi:hypothetical protein
MIAKQGWFKRRKYTGWGFSPATWQGWVYLTVLLLPFALISSIKIVTPAIIVTITAVWFLVLILAFIDIALSIKKDERETIHEAIADRNALWAMLAALIAGIGYEASKGIVEGVAKVDPVILIALASGLIVKALSNIYLDRKN